MHRLYTHTQDIPPRTQARAHANTLRFSSGSSRSPTCKPSLRLLETACWSLRPRYLAARASLVDAKRADDGTNSAREGRGRPSPREFGDSRSVARGSGRTLVLVEARAVEAPLEDLDRVQHEPRTDLGEREVRRALLLGELLRLDVGERRGGRGCRREGVGGRSIEDLCSGRYRQPTSSVCDSS